MGRKLVRCCCHLVVWVCSCATTRHQTCFLNRKKCPQQVCLFMTWTPSALCSLYYVQASVLCCVDITLHCFPPVSPYTERASPTSLTQVFSDCRELEISCPVLFTNNLPITAQSPCWEVRFRRLNWNTFQNILLVYLPEHFQNTLF